jgi:hypothetical protein
MLKLFWKSLLVTPAILGAALAVSTAANAVESTKTAEVSETPSFGMELAQAQPNTTAEDQKVLNQIDNYNNDSQSTDQITSVSELRDVSPTDWAYEALRSLVERYGCIVGYPNATYRGDRALSRWEFAAGLNACMDAVLRSAASKEDLEKLKRLMQEFEAELAALGARVDNLEGRVSFMEDHQFSTTTKLNGEAIFAIAGASTAGNQFVFQDRVRLALNTSFTGSDRLVTRLTAGNAQQFNSQTNLAGGGQARIPSPTTNMSYFVGSTGDNSVSLDWLAYYAPIDFGGGFKLNAYLAAAGGTWYDFVPTLNPYFQDFDGGNGGLSAFSQENPIYRIGGGAGGGVSLQLDFLKDIIGPSALSVGYFGGNSSFGPDGANGAGGCLGNNNMVGGPNVPSGTAACRGDGNGLFNGNSAILAQINANIFGAVNLGFTYVNAYSTASSPLFGAGSKNFGAGIVGTPAANGTFGTDPNNVLSNTTLGARNSNSYGVGMTWNIANWLTFNAFGSYTSVGFRPNTSTLGTFLGGATGDVWTYGGGFAFPDLGKEGSILGLYAGVQPFLGGNAFNLVNTAIAGAGGTNFLTTSNPISLELFYKYPVTDNITLTPGVMWISNPGQVQGGQGQVIGVLRGTFTF